MNSSADGKPLQSHFPETNSHFIQTVIQLRFYIALIHLFLQTFYQIRLPVLALDKVSKYRILRYFFDSRESNIIMQRIKYIAIIGMKNNKIAVIISIKIFSTFRLNIPIIRVLNTYSPKITSIGNIFKKFLTCLKGIRMHAHII